MAVESIAAATSSNQPATNLSSKELSDQFLQLLVAQLKHQDPLEPMKNEEFVSELAQLQALNSTVKISELNQSLLFQSSLSTGAALIGGQVTGLVSGDEGVSREVSGSVQSVKVEGGKVIYAVKTADGSVVNLSPENVLSISPALAATEEKK